MALALKTTGLAALVRFCILVDDDGTVVDLKGSAVVAEPQVTTGSATWKGTSRRYFTTSGLGEAAYSVRYNSTAAQPSFPTNTAAGCAVFVALSSCGVGSTGITGTIPQRGFAHFGASSLTTSGLLLDANDRLLVQQTSTEGVSGTTVMPVNGTTKFSVATNWVNATRADLYYGLESGSLVLDRTTVAPQRGSASATLVSIGGYEGFGWLDAKFHIVVGFSRALTLAEMQSLHNNWYGTLLEVSGGSGVLPTAPTAGTTTNITSSSATLNWTDNSVVEDAYDIQLETPSGANNWSTVSGSPTGPNVTSIAVTGLSASTQYRPRFRARNANGDVGWVNGTAFTTLAATTKKVKVVCHPDAAGATGVTLEVHSAPASTGLTGTTRYGHATGQAFEESLEGGEAVLKVAASAVGASALAAGTEVRVLFTGTSDSASALGNAVPFGSVGAHTATIIEE